MRHVWKKMFGGDCDHRHTLEVNSVGVRRTVCEKCGHMSFEMDPEITCTRKETEKVELPQVAGL